MNFWDFQGKKRNFVYYFLYFIYIVVKYDYMKRRRWIATKACDNREAHKHREFGEKKRRVM